MPTAPAPHPSPATAPLVWLLEPYRAGEQQQALALAEALGGPFVRKRLRHHRLRGAATNLGRGSGLAGIDRRGSDALTPPWPDLLITAGMRNEPVARWVRRQSGGRTRLVHIGRPWADPGAFDLVITTPQYRLPQRPNVLHNDLPLHRVHADRLAAAAARWAPTLGHLPAPRIAVIVGGNSGPYTLGARAARRLLADAAALARDAGGSLLITTSPRTPAAALRVLETDCGVPAQCYVWRAGDPDNPYFGYLALADALVVTADSISMLAEAGATGKPLYLFDLGDGRHRMRPGAGEGRDDPRLGAVLYRALMRWGWQRLSRDITLVHRRLIASGRAAWLGEALPAPPGAVTDVDMQRALARVRALLV